MGHHRLGSIPKSRKWETVVAEIASGGAQVAAGFAVLSDDIQQVASRTLEAAEPGLERAIRDPGLRFTFYVLTQLVLSAREQDWAKGLSKLGIQLPEAASIFDLTAEVQRIIDDHVAKHGRSTDVSEMAQQAAGEAISILAGPRAKTLFGTGEEEVKEAVRELSTKAGFSRLGQRFFGSFMARFLNFYLSRITVGQVGGARLNQLGDLSHFNETLQTHCYQSARIVHDFCGEWYSKTEFQKGIDLDNTSGFMAVALKKLRDELKRQREGK